MRAVDQPKVNGEPWFCWPTVVLDVAKEAHTHGELTTCEELLEFFETPWSFPELYERFPQDR